MLSVETKPNHDSSSFRLDVPLHSLLTQPGSRTVIAPAIKPNQLPDPVFPQYPQLLGDPPMPPPGRNYDRHYKSEHIARALPGWAVPWLKSHVLPGDFHPIIAYLFNGWKCNLDEMRNFIRGKVQDWNRRAGLNSLIVRTDGTLAPCFPMYSATYNWGTIENHRFETKQLSDILAFCYNDARVIKWIFRQALNRFQGTTNFD
jgi:hypothetical protein